MTTKEQERKALAQIRKIVESLGENSYIGTALEGCLEDAADNIENDWAMSMKDRFQSAEKQIEKLSRKIEMLRKEDEAKADEIKRLQEEEFCMKNIIEDLTSQITDLKEDVMNERKDVTVNGDCRPFKEVRFMSCKSFRFVVVVDESGWTTSYKVEDLNELVIK